MARPRARVASLTNSPGSLVGAIEDASFTSQQVILGPGDALLLYTDGVTEGRNGREFYGENRLLNSVVAESAAALVEAVLNDVVEFQGGDPRDDIALLAVRVPD